MGKRIDKQIYCMNRVERSEPKLKRDILTETAANAHHKRKHTNTKWQRTFECIEKIRKKNYSCSKYDILCMSITKIWWTEMKEKVKFYRIALLCFAPVLNSVFFHILRIERQGFFREFDFSRGYSYKGYSVFHYRTENDGKEETISSLNELRLCVLHFDLKKFIYFWETKWINIEKRSRLHCYNCDYALRFSNNLWVNVLMVQERAFVSESIEFELFVNCIQNPCNGFFHPGNPIDLISW